MHGIPLIIQRRFFYGWMIVAVSFLCWLVADAFGLYTFGLFMRSIREEFQWSTGAITFALTLRTLMAGVAGPLIGYLADKKYGARVLMPGGVLAAGAAAILVSRMQTLWQFYFFYGIIGALGMVGFGGLVTHTIIAKWFIRKRGRAMAIATMGVSISGMIFVPLCQYLISHYGWRTTLLTLGLIIWAVAFLPVALFIRRSPEDMGLLPDGDAPAADSAPDREPGRPGPITAGEFSWTLGQALKTKALWLLLVAFNVTGLAMNGVIVHLVPYIEAKNLSSTVAATAMTVIATTCAIVKIPWGVLAEKISARYCLIGVYSGCALGLGILLAFQGKLFAFVFAVVYGAALGGMMVLREILFAEYYGRAFLGAIRGVVMPLNLVSMAGGPLFAAWLRDVTGSYYLAYLIFFGAWITGAVFMFLAKPPVRSAG